MRIENPTFSRLQSGSYAGKDTHTWKQYRSEFEWALKQTNTIEGEIVDPFARKCKWGTITNDIDENQPTDFHLDGADFLEQLPSSSAKIILFDPPFSSSQSEKYEVGNTNLYASGDGRIARMNKEIGRIMKPGGNILNLR